MAADAAPASSPAPGPLIGPVTSRVADLTKKRKQKHGRRHSRAESLDVGGLMCVVLGMVLSYLYVDYRFPGVLSAMLPDENWSFSERMKNGIASTTRKAKKKAAERRARDEKRAEREAELELTPMMPLWEALQPERLEKLEWQPETSPSQLAKLRRPAVYTRTPAEGWAVRRTWTPDFLAEHENLQRLDGVYHHPKGYFLHHDDTAPLVTPGASGAPAALRWEPPYTTLNCTARCFFGAVQYEKQLSEHCDAECNAKTMPLSFSTELGPRFGSLWEDLKGYTDFSVSTATAVAAAAAESKGDAAAAEGESAAAAAAAAAAAGPTVNMWLASAGSTTAMHYDSYHNFFVQLHGKKRFFLLPPSAATALYAHPRVRHTSHQSAQCNIGTKSHN